MYYLNESLCLNYVDISRRAALAEELSILKQVDGFAAKGLSPPRGKNGFARYNLSQNTLICICNSIGFYCLVWNLMKMVA